MTTAYGTPAELLIHKALSSPQRLEKGKACEMTLHVRILLEGHSITRLIRTQEQDS